ncbi:hypothetical protein OAK99_01555 [Akkermansiaceae bacterium]|nr:hypothetical protein [Akkermansiaceae bacterium]
MTTHFINLASWRYFEEEQREQQKYLDSVSIVVLARLFGYRIERVSGVKYYRENSARLQKSLFLLAKEDESFKHSYILPFWESVEEVSLSPDLKRALISHQSCVIGIGSPKQDFLARLIKREFPNIKIFCLGAAICVKEKENIFIKKDIGVWLYFLLTEPKRTMGKLRITILEISKIIFFKYDRLAFDSFLKRF